MAASGNAARVLAPPYVRRLRGGAVLFAVISSRISTPPVASFTRCAQMCANDGTAAIFCRVSAECAQTIATMTLPSDVWRVVCRLATAWHYDDDGASYVVRLTTAASLARLCRTTREALKYDGEPTLWLRACHRHLSRAVDRCIVHRWRRIEWCDDSERTCLVRISGAVDLRLSIDYCERLHVTFDRASCERFWCALLSQHQPFRSACASPAAAWQRLSGKGAYDECAALRAHFTSVAHLWLWHIVAATESDAAREKRWRRVIATLFSTSHDTPWRAIDAAVRCGKDLSAFVRN